MSRLAPLSSWTKKTVFAQIIIFHLDISATLSIGTVRKKPTDYIEGEIVCRNRIVSKMNGSYMGFLEFDGKRYWDARHVLPFRMKVP
jgi:hypothetical protein